MNIVLATDDNFVQHCGVAMMSILKNNDSVCFYVLTEGLKKDNEEKLKTLVESNGGTFNLCKVPSNIVKYFPMSKMASSHISIATYYRLFITSLLPKEIDKVIYLDCDMVVQGSLADLWNTDLSGYALAAVYQDFGWSDHEHSWDRLGIDRNFGYFNAGCLLLNLSYLRKDSFQEKAIRYINEHFNRIVSHDQDVLNALYYKKVKPLSCKWNYMPLFMNGNLSTDDFPSSYDYLSELSSTTFNPIIIHFVSKPKPWQVGCRHPLRDTYYEYLSYTIWSGFTPKFKFNEYLNCVVIPCVKRYARCIIDKLTK